MITTEVGVSFLDLKRQYEPLRSEVLEAVDRVFTSTQFVLGDEVAAFENEFAQFSGARYGIALNSGTSAIHLALLAAGIQPGDEVITVAMTFVATVAAIQYAGARAVLVDVDPVTYTMDVEKIEAAITPRTKAIVPVHLYGQPANMDAIREIADRHHLVVIEDAAQAHGAETAGSRVGGLGQLACFSFYPGKNLGAYGEGGLVTTNDEALASKIRILRDWGQTKRYEHTFKGFNYRMDGVQGAILRIKLRHLEQWTEARREHANQYEALLSESGLTLPRVRHDVRHVYHIYAVMHPKRDALRAKLQEVGIATGLHYPIPVHLQKAYADLGYKAGDFPVAERVAREEMSLPMFAELTHAEVELVATSTLEALHRVDE